MALIKTQGTPDTCSEQTIYLYCTHGESYRIFHDLFSPYSMMIEVIHQINYQLSHTLKILRK
jgi:hypothetical protein